MQFLDVIAWVGAIISWWGTGRYMLEIARGNTQPRLASWIAWATANGVLMVVALLNDSTLAAVFNGLAALGNVSVLVLSGIKRAGDRPHGATDWTCLAATGLCLFCILMWPHATYMVAPLAMLANIVATWPTIQHAWQRPQEEAWQLFAANAGANGLGLAGVAAAGGMGLANIAGPLISMVGNAALVSITLGRGMLNNAVQVAEEEIEEVQEFIAEELAPVTPPPSVQPAVKQAKRIPIDGISWGGL